MSDEACLDFDLAFIDFQSWMRSKQDETVWSEPEDAPKGKVRKPKYETFGAIFREYDTGVSPGENDERHLQVKQELDELISDMVVGSAPTF